MKLTSLRISGFKTFATSTTLTFDSGITAIVGPNGSGKSNLVDAIRWVLGEQSSKSLRSSKTDDVIFTGNDRRKPLGTAEVSLTFDNSDGRIDIPASEIQITRRAYRGGEIEYYLNRERVRLRDVHEMLMGTGLGPGSYAIVSQGQIDAILASRPSERRALFEETSGVNKFLARKAEALRRLEGTNGNIVRLNDAASDVLARLPELDTQVRRAKRYRNVSSTVRDYEVLAAVRAGDGRRLARRTAYMQSLGASNQLAFARLERERLEREGIALRERSARTERAFEEARSAHESSRLALAAAERDAAGERVRLETLVARSAANTQDRERRETERARLDAELVALRETLSPLRERCESLKLAESHARHALSALRDSFDQLLKAQRENDQRLHRSMQDATERRVLLESAEREEQRLSREIERLAGDVARLEPLAQNGQTELDQLEISAQDFESKRQAAEVQFTAAEERRTAANAALPQAQANLSAVTRELASLEARLHTLEELDAHLEGHVPGTRAVIEAKNRGELSGIIGVVSSLVNVEEQYARALDIAFGAGVSNIITERSHDAESAIEYLRSRELGRATFLPLDLNADRRGHDLGRLRSFPGVIAYAHELVRCEPQYRGVIAFLVGRTLVVDTMRTGVTLAREHSVRESMVTLEGDQLIGGGALSGGRSRRGERSILSRKAESETLRAERLPEVREALTDAEADSARAAAEMKRATDARDEARAMLTEMTAGVRESQSRLATLRGSVANAAASLRSALDRCGELEAAHAAVCRRLEELPRAIEQGQDTAETERFETAVQDARRTITEAETRLHALTREVQQAQERVSHAIADEARGTARRAALDHDDDRVNELHGTAADELARLREENTRLDTHLAELSESVTAAETLRKATSDQRNASIRALSQSEAAIAAAQERERTAGGIAETARLRVAELDAEIGMLCETLGRLPTSAEERAEIIERYRDQPDSITNDLPRLRDELARLSASVNLNAEAERDEVAARHVELTTQLEDIIKARDLLLAGIRDLDDQSRVQFVETFERVQAAFRDTYADLFPGGEAKMWLSDPENAGESGVEISVQPPGKRMTSLAALSGGERAMTAAALIFALIRVKPSPFYLLDEIDAALDEMNVERFSRMVRNLADEAQLLIVTHNKKTMELAQRMYGLTMAEAGVSSVITASLDRENAVA